VLWLILYSVSALVLKLPPDVLSPFVHRLSNIKTTNSVDTSIPATALRTFITAFPRPLLGVPPTPKTEDAYSAISRVLIPRLLGYIVINHGLENLPTPPPGMLEIGQEKGANNDAVDILIEVVRCFGPMLQDKEKEALEKAIVSILDDERTSTVIKKKAVVAISILAVYMSDKLLSTFVSSTIRSFRSTHLMLAKRKLLISMVGSLSRSVPQRLGPYLKTLAPFVLSALSEEEYEESMEELAEDGEPNLEIEEVREAGLVALEGCLSSCSNAMRMFTNESIDAALRYAVYDPNSAADEGDEEMGGTQGEDEEDADDAETNGFDDAEEDYEEDGALSDDEDASWKVRRCAAKALYALISTRSNGDLLDDGTLYDRVAPVLISRFKEKEENVRLEVLATFASLIRKTGEGVSLAGPNIVNEFDFTGDYASPSRKRRRVNSDADGGVLSSSMGLSSPAPSPPPISGPKADLARLSPAIVRGIARLVKQNSTPTKQLAITLLRDLIVVQHGALADNMSKVIDALLDAVKSSASSSAGSASIIAGGAAAASGSKMRIEALQLISAICDTHSSKVIAPYIGSIVPSIVLAIRDRYYKISSEALLTVESIVKVLTPPRSAGSEKERKTHLSDIYDAILSRATATDADLEVRQRAIHALGVLLGRTSASSNAKLITADKRIRSLGVLHDRLKNEITRVSAVKAVDLVAASATDQSDLQTTWVQNVTLELGAQLRKADRILRGASLTALRSFVANAVALASMDDDTVYNISGMLLRLINAHDLSLLGLAMSVLGKLVKRNPKRVVDSNLDNALCGVVLAPLSGAVFESYLGLVKIIGDQAVGQPLMQGLLQNVGVSGDPAVVGKAIGTLLVSGSTTVGVTINDFSNELRTSKDSQRKCLALSILGEAGLRLGSSSPLEPSVFTAHFSSKSENVPRAAAVALGRAGAGNINTYLPIILSNSGKAGNLQYLSLHSIKEILQHAGKAHSDISPYTNQIWEKLLVASQAEDNKAIGAECIGKITIIEPKTFLPMLQVGIHLYPYVVYADYHMQNYLQDPTPTVRGMIIQAIRFTLADSDDSFDEALKPLLMKMLTTMLNDPNLENRRLALSTLNAATQHKGDIVLPHLAQLIPLVMKESRINIDLIREVQMGPFKHKIDDGLELRKVRIKSVTAASMILTVVFRVRTRPSMR